MAALAQKSPFPCKETAWSTPGKAEMLPFVQPLPVLGLLPQSLFKRKDVGSGLKSILEILTCSGSLDKLFKLSQPQIAGFKMELTQASFGLTYSGSRPTARGCDVPNALYEYAS